MEELQQGRRRRGPAAPAQAAAQNAAAALLRRLPHLLRRASGELGRIMFNFLPSGLKFTDTCRTD